MDEATFARLTAAGAPLRRGRQVVLVDQEVDVGRTFAIPSLPDHIVFSRTGAQRAKDLSLSFDGFLQSHPQPHARQWVLRPREGAVQPDDLAAAMRLLSGGYDDAMKRLVASHGVAPLLATLHLRWMPEVSAFDLHLHCLWNSPAEAVPGIHDFLARRFGFVWHADEVARNAGAVVNYDVSGVIDHADLATWPPDALLAVSRLTRVRFHRPAGAFAAFRSSLASQGVRLRRGRHGIERIAIERRPTRRVADPMAPEVRDTFRGLRRMRLDGRMRTCAIHVLPDLAAVGPGGNAVPVRSPLERGAPSSIEDTNPPSTPRLVDRPGRGRIGGAAFPASQPHYPMRRGDDGSVHRDGQVTRFADCGTRRSPAQGPSIGNWWQRLRVLIYACLIGVWLAPGALWHAWRLPHPTCILGGTCGGLTWHQPRRAASFDACGSAGRRLRPPIRAGPLG